MIKSYGYSNKTQLSAHFNVHEFKCKCGKVHDIKVDTNLVNMLEKLRTLLNAKACIIYSGHRCSAHDIKVGGSGRGPHTYGYAVDCYFKDKNNNRIPSSKVACLLEDLGHGKGIGLRCGGSSVASGNIHIDTKPRRWYGDEYYSFSKSISSLKAVSDGKTGHNTYLSYCFKPVEKTVTASYLNCRNGKGTNYKIVGGYKRGTKVKVYYSEDGWSKLGVNKWVSTQYLK